ncbi:MAG: hypothetical protein NWE89_11250 [Candidatus Bathyarchaeota archaeon]|nr:hypothetical protein [Candidatus Bathyarchaeota archaeon]
MNPPAFEEIKETIEARLQQTIELLGELEFQVNTCTAREFYDYLTGETFSGDKITLRDILGNEYLILHEVVEVSELKRLGVELNTSTLMEAPKEKIYEAHLNAMRFELEYALLLEDYYWLKHRLGHHKDIVEDDMDSRETEAHRKNHL